MKIHEYQAKEIFVRYGIPINPGYLCHSVDDAINSYEKLDYDLVVVKAQVHTGG
ncbi:MAG: succinate--CoA ligase subunit beta, partial [Dysgonamonadaceae bacterium]|nr:succinate--CoA ligase subunit beta [Dysgonamonadaceae bacterium]MDD4247198.1 succinate--CoA ligase subunit beta [Dysgonamonadaceae bacterium]